MPAAEARRLCVSLHDVAPQTWPQCQRLLQLLDAWGAPPVTLLVVPDYHRGMRIDRDRGFVRAIDGRIARGDEVALHGYCHLDEAPTPRHPHAWFQRRVLTRSEGEFAAIDAGEASRRIQAGLALLQPLGWHIQGFVPPAWLMGPGLAQALTCFDFRYTTVRTGLIRLPSWQFVRAPSLVFSVGAAWRHAMSRALNQASLGTSASVVRVSLHPVDADCPAALAHWARVLPPLIARCRPVTKAQWASGEASTGTRRAA